MANTPYLIGSNSAASGGSTLLTIAVGTSVAAQDSINVGVLVNVAGVTVTVSDTQGNPYTQVVADTVETTAQLNVWQCEGAAPLTAGTDQIFVLYSATTSVQGAIAVGDNGVISSDTVSFNQAATGTTASIATGTLQQAEENLVCFLVTPEAGGVPAWTYPAGGLLANINAASTTRISAQYGLVNAITSVTPSATIVSGPWAIAVVPELVAAPFITTVLQGGVIGVAYSQTLLTSGGHSPYTYSVSSGSLPPGITLASGVISGTPTTAGTYPVTLQVTDTNSIVSQQPMQITIVYPPVQASTVIFPNNLLSFADSEFESGVGTWAAETNASGLTTTTIVSVTGDTSLMWTATAPGLTQVHTGLYPCEPNAPYIASGIMFPQSIQNECYIGMEFYTSGGTLINSQLGDIGTATGTPLLLPVQGTFTSPPLATQFRMFAQVNIAGTGDVCYLDLAYVTQTNAQVLIDFVNNPFVQPTLSTTLAGSSFSDVSSFVKMDAGISMNRGRQDAISEVQTGSCTFQLQNDTGIFTRKSLTSFIATLGGNITLGRRVQVNLADQNGLWYTRFDGPIAAINYSFDNTGNTSVAAISVADILAFMQRQQPLGCWTFETVLADNPVLCYPMDDSAGEEVMPVMHDASGNAGPPLRPWNSDKTNAATATFSSLTGGIETLGDSSSPLSGLDGSEYWTAGNNQPSSAIRGLDAGVPGPFSTPAGGVQLVPTVTATSTINTFTSNAGWQMNVNFPQEIINTNASGPYTTIECWFTMDPSVKAAAASGTKVGPYIVMSLGGSRQNDTIVAGIFMDTATTVNFEIDTYSQPPAFILNNAFGNPVATGGTALNIIPDSVPVPHHLVLQITTGLPTNVVSGWLDTNFIGQVTLRQGATFDTLCLGGAYGGYGNHFGNIQMASIYSYPLSMQQITTHCSVGQYGMWESTTDDTIAALGNIAGIPAFWSNLTASHSGLTMCDYLDLSGSSALANMQIYEQAEQGLLYVNAAGQLSFYTRDWKMGYGAPDVLFNPDTFDSQMGYQVVDQYLVNEAYIALSSTSAQETTVETVFAQQNGIDSSGSIIIQAGWDNLNSQAEYGVYASNGASSPLQLPLFAFSRAFNNLGIPALSFWPDPNLTDQAQWMANHFSEPFQTPGQLIIDDLTLDTTTSGLSVSSLYTLEIGNMVAPSGALPASFPNVTGSLEWFIEGIYETITQNSRTWSAYMSPAAQQRAWIPGDPVYGVLGTTSQIGLSAADTSQPQADGKDVSHDGGPPYWPPAFTTTKAINPNPLFANGSLTGWSAFQGTIAADPGTLYPGGPYSYSAVLTSTGGLAGALEGTSEPVVSYSQGFESGAGGWVPATNCSAAVVSATEAETGTHSLKATVTASGNMLVGAGNAFTTSAIFFPVGPSQQITFSSWVWATAAGRTVQQALSVYDQFGNNVSGGFGILGGAAHAVTNGAWTQISDVFTMPATAATIRILWMQLATPAASEVVYYDDMVIQLGGNTYSVGAWINPATAQNVAVGVDWQSASGAYLSTSLGPSTAVTPGTWTFVTAPALVTPLSAAAAYPRANAAVSGTVAVQDLRLVHGSFAPADMNNPAQNGHGFVGSRDIRGLHDTLALALQPPVCVVGAVSNSQSIPSGSASTEITWDTIFIDTAAGMGAVAGWPNWYLVTVPGFYDIDAAIGWNNATSTFNGEAFIVVAADAAQAVAAGTGTPLTIGQYVSPIGESSAFNSFTINNVNAPSARLYLGVGDMVAIAAEQNSGTNPKGTATNWGGSRFSLLWRGYGRTDDRVQINTSIASGGTVTNKVQKVAGQYVMTSSTTYSYNGYNATKNPNEKFGTNTYAYQGEYLGSARGTIITQILFPWTAMRAALTAAGATVTSVTLQGELVNSVLSGTDLVLGWAGGTPGQSGYTFNHSNDHQNLIQQHFYKGQTITFTLPKSFWSNLVVGGSATMLVMGLTGQGADSNSFRGQFNGGPGWWTMTINYLH